MKHFLRNSLRMPMASLNTRKIGILVSITSLLILTFSTIMIGTHSLYGKDKNRDVLAFTALLNGGQEVPENDSNAFGIAFMTLERDSKMISYSITFTDEKLSGTETAAHFHASANPGESAEVVFTITPDVSPLGSPKTGSVGPLTNKQIRDLRKGLFYLNIHTSAFSNGEIRGQVIPIAGVRFRDVSEEE